MNILLMIYITTINKDTQKIKDEHILLLTILLHIKVQQLQSNGHIFTI